MWKLIPTGQFKKDLKRYRNKPEKLASLKSVLDLLQENGEVPHEYDPHMLKSIRLSGRSSVARFILRTIRNTFI